MKSSYYGKGILNKGEYTIYDQDGRLTKCFHAWQDLLRRCYDNKYKEKYPTYKNVTVSDEWYNYQNFAKWFDENYYEINNEQMCLDKDILHKGNKVYCPENCVFVPQKINKLFETRKYDRGEYPIGVNWNKKANKYFVQCKTFKKNRYVGYYNTVEEAFKAYKTTKETHIKEVADMYKDFIPYILYKAMYDYKVEIHD